MSVFEGRNSDSSSCRNDQDDLAMFELSSAPSRHEVENQSVYVFSNVSVNASKRNGYGGGDGDSDGDSDVIVIDTTPAILAEKIGADYECMRHVKESSKPANGPSNGGTATRSIANSSTIHTSTGYEKQDRTLPLAKQNRNVLTAAKQKQMKKGKLKRNYDKVFEGCNSFEPIEIDDDSEDDGCDDRSIEDGESNCGMPEGKRTGNSDNYTAESSTVSKPTVANTKIGRKRSRSVLEKRGKKGKQSHLNKIDDVNAVNPISSGKYPHKKRNDNRCSITTSAVSNTANSVIDVDASNKTVVVSTEIKQRHDADTSGDIDGQATLPQTTFEVINLTGDDDDDDNDDEYTNPKNDNAHSIDKESSQNNREEETQRKLGQVTDPPTRIALKTRSLASEAPKARQNRETTKTAFGSREAMMESEAPSSPRSNYVGNTDCSKENSDCFEEHVHNCSRSSRRQVEIIDVDEIEIMERDTEQEGNTDSNAKGSKTRIATKPRFKPIKSKRIRKRETESNSVARGEMFSSAKMGESFLEKSHSTVATSHPHYDFTRKANNGENNEVGPNSHLKRKISSQPEKRFIFHPSNGKPENHYTNNFLGMNIDDAHKEQERLLKRAAARVRNQPVFQVTSEPSALRKAVQVHSITFSTLVQDVHLQYPNHFKFANLYSRLGLPSHANESMIKSQYRRLARVYHPDRNIGKPDTRHKFQAVTEAYNYFMGA